MFREHSIYFKNNQKKFVTIIHGLQMSQGRNPGKVILRREISSMLSHSCERPDAVETKVYS